MREEQELTVCSMTAEMDQSARDLVKKCFYTGCSRLLITTDLFGPDSDVLVTSSGMFTVNYDIPGNRETYIGRVGARVRECKSTAITLVGEREMPYLKDVETFYAIAIEELHDSLIDMLI